MEITSVAKTLKYIDAGGIQLAAVYDRGRPRDSERQRAAKHRASSAAQRRMNQIYSAQKLELMLSANFPTPGSALVVTLTHDDAHMPKSRKEAQARFKYFLKKLRAARAAAGLPEPVVFWAPEILTSASGRWHQHIVLDSTGRDFDMLRRCWIYGSDIEIRRLGRPEPHEPPPAWERDDAEEPDNYYRAVARYMTKELRECQEYETRPGLHGWSCTRNAVRPEIETAVVPDDFELTPPEGCRIYIDECKKTEWASYRVIKFRLEAHLAAPRPARRRRRPR